MRKIGLTGGIGSGKSTVAHFFRLLNIPIYEADAEAKKLINTDLQIKKRIIELLGKDAYNSSGIYNSKWVSSQVFGKPETLQQLNQIIHPEVKIHFEEWCLRHNNGDFIIKEAALMNKTSEIDQIWYVDCPEELRLQRVLKRDPQRSKEDVLKIMKAQKSDQEFREIASEVIVNDEKSLMIPQLLNLLNKAIQ